MGLRIALWGDVGAGLGAPLIVRAAACGEEGTVLEGGSGLVGQRGGWRRGNLGEVDAGRRVGSFVRQRA